MTNAVVHTTGTMEGSTTDSCCDSGHTGHGMQGRPLQPPLSDGLQLVLCISP